MLVLDRDTKTVDFNEDTREGRQETRTLSQYGPPIEMTDLFADEEISLPGSASDTRTGENGLACQVAPDAVDYIECHSLETEVDAAVRRLQSCFTEAKELKITFAPQMEEGDFESLVFEIDCSEKITTREFRRARHLFYKLLRATGNEKLYQSMAILRT